MFGIKDDKGYNQGYKDSAAMIKRTKRRADYIINLMAPENKEVLEIGCGRGEISFYIASKTKNNVLGTDICVPFIEKAKSKYNLSNLNFDVLDFNCLDKIENKIFDYIVGNGILHHLYYNIDEVLQSSQKLLKPNGEIIFLEPNLFNPYCYLIFNTTKFFREYAKLEPTEKAFTKKFIKEKLLKLDFIDIKVEYRDFLLPIIPSFLISTTILIGSIFEQIPILKNISQSLFISAKKKC